MTDPIDGSRRARGPYGTNSGDIWLAPEWMQERIRGDEGPGWRVVVEMLDGEEGMYVTELPELIEAAEHGHERWVAERAAQN